VEQGLMPFTVDLFHDLLNQFRAGVKILEVKFLLFKVEN
jgi:hypothetical protein